MNEHVLKAEKRSDTGKSAAKRLRTSGRIPGVCYGSGDDAIPFSVDTKEFVALLKKASENVIVSLDIEGKKQNVIIRELQRDYLKDELLHVDMNRISMTEKIEVEVTVELEGEPLGVKEEDGVLDHSLRSVHIKCLPTDIPDHFAIDVSELNIGDSVRVSDLPLDTSKFELLTDPELAVASVTHAISEDDLKVQLEEGEGEPEVIGEEQEEGEAEEAAPEKQEEEAAKPEAKPEDGGEEKPEKKPEKKE